MNIYDMLSYALGVPALIGFGYYLCWYKHNKVIHSAQQSAVLLEDAVKTWEKMK